jgi:putative effector of murein hydrolase LrgA (UPF0299 family)
VNPVRAFLGSWLLLALVVGASGWFERATALEVAATVWGLVLLLAVLRTTWSPFRIWVETLELDALVALHLTRFVGVAFLTLYLSGRLPATFAVPAGIGDIIVALTAGLALIAWMPTRTTWQRWFLLVWNLVGLLDIVAVVVTALSVGLKDWHGMAPLRALPLSLLPTFLVPLIIGSHAEIFRRLARVPVHEQQTWKGRAG